MLMFLPENIARSMSQHTKVLHQKLSTQAQLLMVIF